MDLRLAYSKLSGSLTTSNLLQTSCEPLERRQLLAGSVSASISGAGDLIISGDNEGNQLAVEIAEDGTVSITGSGGTTVDLGNLDTERVQKDIRITLRGGDDNITLYGSGAFVPVRRVKLNSGSGDDDVFTNNLLNIERDLVISTGSGDDSVLVEYTGVGRNLTINGASGLNELRVENTEVGDEEEELRGTLRVSSSSGDDEIHIVQSSVDGNIDLRSGSGNDLIDIEDSTAMYGGDFNTRSGGGNDRVYMDSSGIYSAPGSGKYGQQVSVNTSNGDDLVEISNMSQGQLLVSSGNGNDDVVISGSDTEGMDLRLGGGEDVVDFEAGNVVGDGPFRINGNNGTDAVRDLGLVTSPIAAELISIENQT